MRIFRAALMSGMLAVSFGSAIADPPKPFRIDVSDVLRIDESCGGGSGPIARFVEWIMSNIK